MYKKDLINAIEEHYQNDPKQSEIILQNLSKIKYITQKSDTEQLLFNVPRNKFVYESIRCELCKHNYNVYLYSKKKVHCTNIVLPINYLTGLSILEQQLLSELQKKDNVINVVIIISPNNETFNKYFIKIERKMINTLLCYDRVMLSNPVNFSQFMTTKYLIGLPLFDNVCVPNMEIINDELMIYNETNIEKLISKIHDDISDKYHIKISVKHLQKMITKCHEHGFEIYKGQPERDTDTDIVKKFHLDVKKSLYKKYCHNINFLFDSGCGRLTDLFYWNDSGIRNVYCVEPSVDSIESGKKRYEKVKRTIKTNILVINGFGDIDWETDVKYRSISDKKYDVITFHFTIHYMIDNIDMIMKNLKLISKNGTKIIITCMDGNLIKEHLKSSSNSQIVVKNKNGKIIFAIGEYSDNSILVYLKGGYGMEYGSIEKIVDIDKLQKTFSKNNFKLIERKPFLQYDSNIKNIMTKEQKNISLYYTSIIFSYN